MNEKYFLFEIKRFSNQSEIYQANETNLIILNNSNDIDYIDDTIVEIKVNVKNNKRKRPLKNDSSIDSKIVLNETDIDNIFDYEQHMDTTTTTTTTRRQSFNNF